MKNNFIKKMCLICFSNITFALPVVPSIILQNNTTRTIKFKITNLVANNPNLTEYESEYVVSATSPLNLYTYNDLYLKPNTQVSIHNPMQDVVSYLDSSASTTKKGERFFEKIAQNGFITIKSLDPAYINIKKITVDGVNMIDPDGIGYSYEPKFTIMEQSLGSAKNCELFTIDNAIRPLIFFDVNNTTFSNTCSQLDSNANQSLNSLINTGVVPFQSKGTIQIDYATQMP